VVIFGRRSLAACVVVIAAVDLFLWRTSPPVVLDGLTDWAAHLGTAVLVLAVLPRVTRPFVIGALLGAVLIDLDHIPRYLGSDIITAGTPRPYTHSLLTLALLSLAAWRSSGIWRVRLAGAALGLVTHLVRDMAEPGASGVSLLWPLTDKPARLPYVAYAAAVALLFVVGWLRAAPDVRWLRQLPYVKPCA
jgi:inner membrane protein